MSELKDRLRYARKRAGLTQAEVAKRAGIAQPSYAQLEIGKSKKTANAHALARALGVDTEWLVSGVGSDEWNPPASPIALDATLLKRAICEIESAFSILGTKPTIEQKAEAILQRYEALVAGAEGSGDVSTLAVAS